MKKIIIVGLVLGVCGVAHAEKPSVADSLAWKFGYCMGTKQANPNDVSASPEMIISYWNCVAKQPTKTEIEQYRNEYEAFLVQQQTQANLDKDAVLAKLKITKDDWKKLNDSKATTN